jgi:hypothetical protein
LNTHEAAEALELKQANEEIERLRLSLNASDTDTQAKLEEKELMLNKTREYLEDLRAHARSTDESLDAAHDELKEKDQELAEARLKRKQDLANSNWYKEEIARLRRSTSDTVTAPNKSLATLRDQLRLLKKSNVRLKEEMDGLRNVSVHELVVEDSLNKTLEATNKSRVELENTGRALRVTMATEGHEIKSMRAELRLVRAQREASERRAQDAEVNASAAWKLVGDMKKASSEEEMRHGAEMQELRNATQHDLSDEKQLLEEFNKSRADLENSGRSLRVSMATEGHEIKAMRAELRLVRAQRSAAERRAEDAEVNASAAWKLVESMKADSEDAAAGLEKEDVKAVKDQLQTLKNTNLRLNQEIEELRNDTQHELDVERQHVKDLNRSHVDLENTGRSLRVTMATESHEIKAMRAELRLVRAQRSAAERRAEDAEVNASAAWKLIEAKKADSEDLSVLQKLNQHLKEEVDEERNTSRADLAAAIEHVKELNKTRAELDNAGRALRVTMATQVHEIKAMRAELRLVRTQRSEAERRAQDADAEVKQVEVNASRARKELERIDTEKEEVAAIKADSVLNLETQVAKAAGLVQKDAGLLQECHARETKLGAQLEDVGTSRSRELAEAQSEHQLLLDQNEALLEMVRKMKLRGELGLASGGEAGGSADLSKDIQKQKFAEGGERLHKCRTHEGELTQLLEADHKSRKQEYDRSRHRLAVLAKKYVAIARQLSQAHREQKHLLEQNEALLQSMGAPITH